MKLTRRELAAAAVAPAALPQAIPGSEKELETAREDLRRQAGALGRFPLPADTEPDFQFRA
jgi:hypothetical protein